MATRNRLTRPALVVLALSLALVSGCSKASTYSDDLVRAAQAFVNDVKPIGKSTDDIVKMARGMSADDEAAAALIRSWMAPPRTLSSRVEDSIARLAQKLGLDPSEESKVRDIVIDATCSSIGDAVDPGQGPDVAGALADATASAFSERASAEELLETVADIWQDVEDGDVFGLSIIASVTLCSEVL